MGSRIPLKDLPIVWIDLETDISGPQVRPREAKIIEIALVPHDRPLSPFYRRVRPDVEGEITTLAASRYDPLVWEDAPLFKDIGADVRAHVEQCCLAGHNVRGFDQPVLDAELERAGCSVRMLGWPMIDTMQAAFEHLVPLGLEELNLASCCKFVGIMNTRHHTALADAMAAMGLYSQIRRLFHIPYKRRADVLKEWREAACMEGFFKGKH